MDTDIFGGFVGLAITQSMRLVSSVQWAMKQYAVLENHMHSVERVLEYMEIPQEANIHSPPSYYLNPLSHNLFL